MIISEIRINPIKRKDTKLRAMASITFDNCFAVHDIKILDIGNGEYALAMPYRKNFNGEFRDIAHPTNAEMRKMITDAVIKAYRAEIGKKEK